MIYTVLVHEVETPCKTLSLAGPDDLNFSVLEIDPARLHQHSRGLLWSVLCKLLVPLSHHTDSIALWLLLDQIVALELLGLTQLYNGNTR